MLAAEEIAVQARRGDEAAEQARDALLTMAALTMAALTTAVLTMATLTAGAVLVLTTAAEQARGVSGTMYNALRLNMYTIQLC